MLSLALLFACVHDPPMRPMDELPYIAERGLVFSTEEQAFREVQRVMDAAYFEPAGVARLEFSEGILWPVSGGSTVLTRRSLSDPAHARQHIAELGEVLFGQPLALEDWTDEDFWEAYQAYYVASLGRELGKLCSQNNRAPGYDDPYIDDTRARSLELSVLSQLAQINRVPDVWLELYPRFLDALVDQIPPEVTAGIPADPRSYAEYYRLGAAALAEDIHSAEARAAVAMALIDARDQAKQPPIPLSTLWRQFVAEEPPAPPTESPE